jgi:hypothetical protein
MDDTGLVGSWNAASGGSNIELRADGTYTRVSSLDLGITFAYGNISLDDEGTYAVRDGVMTFMPRSGHYRRDGVDEGADLSVRHQSCRLQPNEDRTGYDLVLDDGIWTRVAG